MPPSPPTRLRPDRLAPARAYFARYTKVEGWRLILSVACGLAALAGLAAWAIPGVSGRGTSVLPLTHGRLADPHAAWDGECAACHKPVSFTATPAVEWLDADRRWRDFSCDNCHAAVPHYAGASTDQQQCGACHRDHGGRGHSLTRLPDSDCVVCHGRLTGHADAKATAKDIADFVSGHPELRAVEEWRGREKEKRRLKFSHSLHMTPGISFAPGGKGLKTLADIPERWREQYRRPDSGPALADGDKVRLTCASCHRLDSERQGSGPVKGRDRPGDLPAEPLLPPRAAGAHMLPVTYDQHCVACHPLLQTVGDNRASSQLTLPHRVQPVPLALLMKQQLTALAVGRAEAKKPGGPGGRLDPPQREAIKASVRREVAGLLQEANRGLYNASGICAKCHVLDPQRKEGLPLKVELNIPTVWLAKARFSHSAHRALHCAACHPSKQAEEKDGMTVVRELEPLGIEGIASCQDCHRPRQAVALPGGGQGWRGGVRHRCTDCHFYHNGANPLQGRGARGRDPDEKWPGWESWLRGQRRDSTRGAGP